MNKLLKKIRPAKKQSFLEVMEQHYFLIEVADTTMNAIAWLNPDLGDDEVTKVYLNTIVGLVGEKKLVEFRDTLIKEADKKVNEVKELYSLFGKESN